MGICKKSKADIHLIRNGKNIEFIELNTSLERHGVKVKEEGFGDFKFHHIYQLGEAIDPPYDIVWYPSDCSVVVTVSLDTWKFLNQFTDNFQITGIPYLSKATLYLRECSVLSNSLCELSFVAYLPSQLVQHIE